MAEITVNVRDDIPDALRDALIAQLERRPAPIVGNFADLNRAGASAIAGGGPDEVHRLHPAVDEDEAKAGAQRVLDEEEAVADARAHADDNPEAGPDEDPDTKDPVERRRDGNVDGGSTSSTTTAETDTTATAETTPTPTRRTRRSGGE